MTKSLIISLLLFGACACSAQHSIVVKNNSTTDRTAQMVAVPYAEATAGIHGDFVINDRKGAQVPYQVTYDSLIIFRATVPAGKTAKYTVSAGSPEAVDTIATGAVYAWRKDDLTWENEHCAYRAYGPTLQLTNEHAYGYDLWTKNVPYPVVAKRYHMHKHNLGSFHDDHGEGMDVYTVGPTLGGGTAALLNDKGEIEYPWAYESCEILDNGPLRFTARLVYPVRPNGLREVRLVSLDAGAHLNRTEISFEGMQGPRRLAAGVVVHRQNPDGYVFDRENGIAYYSDLTDNAERGNGTIFVGLVAPYADNSEYRPLPEPMGDAIGHILTQGYITADEPFVYYWGSAWSKGSVADADQWHKALIEAAIAHKSPLKANVK